MKVTSFNDLVKKTLTLVLVQPVTGETFEVEMRELPQPQVQSFLYAEERPKPPVKEFEKNKLTGKIEPVFDFENLDYQKKLSAWNDRFLYRWVLASWVIEDIPGDTEEQRMKALDEMLPSWVINRFREKLEEISGLRDSDIAFEKKKSLMEEKVT